MKTHSITTILAAALWPLGVTLAASESFTLETQVYVYRSSDFAPVKIPGATTTDRVHGVVFHSPATAEFATEKLSLDGARFTWSSGRNPPDRFSLIVTPPVRLTLGKRATLLSTAPVQYLEKLADGTLQVHEIPGDSPEAPHSRLTFAIKPTVNAGQDLQLTCDLDIATVSAREKVPGVTLEVGKPTLARFKEQLDSVVRVGEWSAIGLQAPNGSDYSLLVLLKITPGDAAGAVADAKQAGQRMTAEELDRFASHYYGRPQPELVTDAIEAVGSRGFIKDRARVYAGFFAELFAANPQRIAEWQKLIDRQDKPTRRLFSDSLQLSRAGAILASTEHSIQLNDMCWGAFLASGNPAYLRKLVDQLKFVDERWDRDLFWAGGTAMWSLARNAPQHPLVRATLEAAKLVADARTREIIGTLLEKEPAVIRQQIVDLDADRRSRSPSGVGQLVDSPFLPNSFEASQSTHR